MHPNTAKKSQKAYLAEIDIERQEGLYHDLCARDDPECRTDIEKDLDRTL